MSQAGSSVIHDLVREALHNHQMGRFVEAERIYLRVLAIDPHHSDALHLLGMIAYQTERHETAVELIRKAIAIKGNAASYHSNLGNVLQSQGKLYEAGLCSPARACAQAPLSRGPFESGERLQSYRRAMALSPELAEAATAEAAVLLLQGDFAAGWQGSERRWETKEHDTPARNYPWPRWKGEHLESGQLLIWGEQGIGDEIMFAGLIPDVLRTGNRCVLDCDARLKTLFSRSFPGIDVAPGVTPESHLDLNIAAHLPSGSLPGLFRTSNTAFAATTSPYLLVDPRAQAHFRAHYTDRRKSVGLAWQTKNKKTGRIRSIDLALLAPLFTRPGIQWVSLQYGDHDTLTQEAAAANAPILVNQQVDQFADIDAFAAQIAAMDLVITIDNSTAHLAAALGVPTWVLLPYIPDWRWLQTRQDSPWYPTIRLFRQTELEDWQSVVRRVENALAQTIRGS
jgi:hypothetical protein